MSNQQYFHGQVVQVIRNGLVQHADQQAVQVLLNLLTNPANRPNAVQLIDNLHATIAQAFPGRQGAVTAQELATILNPWVTTHLMNIRNQLNQQAAGGLAMGGMALGGMGMGGMGAMGMGGTMPYGQQQVVPTALLMTDAATLGQPQPVSNWNHTPMTATAQSPSAPPQPVVTAPQPTHLELSFHQASTDDLGKFAEHVKLEGYYQTSYGDDRVSFAIVQEKMAQNSTLELFRTVYRGIPLELLRGLWSLVVDYKQLVHVPIATGRFNTLRAQLGNAFVEGPGGCNWEECLRIINDLPRGEADALTGALVGRINQLLMRRMRLRSNPDYELQIEDLRDLAELFNPNTTLSISRNPEYLTTLKAVIKEVFRTFFVDETVVGRDDANIGDFLRCDKIDYFANGTSKFDLLATNTKADRDNAITSLMDRSTVLRVPRLLVAGNAMPDVAATGTHPFAAERAAVFDATMQAVPPSRLARIEDVLALKRGADPSEYLVDYVFQHTLEGGRQYALNTKTFGW